jgi:hypothetical protein
VHSFKAAAGDTLEVEVKPGHLHARLLAADGRVQDSATLEVSPERRARQQRLDALFAGTEFASPLPLDAHAVMQAPFTK